MRKTQQNNCLHVVTQEGNNDAHHTWYRENNIKPMWVNKAPTMDNLNHIKEALTLQQ